MHTTNHENAAATPASPLGELIPPEEYQQRNATVFRSDTSLDWHIRQNKRALIDGGALLYISGRRLIDPSRFDRITREIGIRAAARRGG